MIGRYAGRLSGRVPRARDLPCALSARARASPRRGSGRALSAGLLAAAAVVSGAGGFDDGAGGGVAPTALGAGGTGVDGGVGTGGVLCHCAGAAGASGEIGSAARARQQEGAHEHDEREGEKPPYTQMRSPREGASVRNPCRARRRRCRAAPRICEDDCPPQRDRRPRVGRSGLMTGKRVPLCETPPGLASMSSAELTVFFHCTNSTSKRPLT